MIFSKRISTAIMLISAFLPMLCFAANVSTYNPRLNNQYVSGHIDSMDIGIKPEGLYTQYDVFIYFGAESNYYWSNQDSLEVQYDFTLPAGHYINDSWLWVEDTIVHAKLIDKWTATQIYENLVHRIRRDPSLLTTSDARNYKLNIFPIFVAGERKVKISFKLPVQWSNSLVSASFLFSNITGGTKTNYPVKLYLYEDDDFKNVELASPSDLTLINAYDEYLHECKFVSTTANKISTLKVQWSNPMQNGVYMNFTHDGADKFYQLAVMPDLLDHTQRPKKVVYCLDYEFTTTNYKLSEILKLSKDFLKSNLNVYDSVAIIASTYSDMIKPDKWIAASPDNIDSIFAFLGKSQLLDFGNTLTVLNTANAFLRNNDTKNASVILWSSSNNLMDITKANKTLDIIKPEIEPGVPINILMLNNATSSVYVNQSNRYYYANEYFYDNLSVFTGGALIKSWAYPYINDAINKFESDIKNSLSFYQVQINIPDGFAYQNYPVDGLSNNVIATTGKYIGTENFEIVTTGFRDDEPFINRKNVDVVNNFDYGPKLSQFWNYKYLQELISRNDKNNALMQEIINKSMSSRIMCIYTAFLALEPWMMKDSDPATSVNDENTDGHVTDVKYETAKGNNLLKAGPNPFTTSTNISVELDNPGVAILEFAIYDVMGNKIIDLPTGMQSGKLSVNWNGVDSVGNQLPSGVYLVVLKTNKETQSLKIVLTN